jgi:molybdopterin converting factor small subunit
MPDSTFSNVVLPQPEGPMMAIISPSPMLTSTPLTACTVDSPEAYSFHNSLASITARMNLLQRNCVDKLPLQSIAMGAQNTELTIAVLCFGPLGEILERNQSITLETPATCQTAIVQLGIEEWLDKGLTVAVNGAMSALDTVLHDGDELALLPPVSGG